jgi:hypothetical protein
LTEKGSLGTCEQVIRGILQYLVKHPEAKDTPEGIYKWWLPDGHRWGRREVQEALDFMTLKGWLTKRKTALTKEVYGINKDKLGEIKNLLLAFGNGN